MSDPKVLNLINRYSDSDLAEFQALINEKLQIANEQVENLKSQALELNENLQANGHDMDESNAISDVEFLNSMIIRQNKHIRDLENALMRIKNKSYGICVHSNVQIDKRRLLAVPTTTKSLQAKNTIAEEEEKKKQAQAIKRPRKVIPGQPKQFITVVKKSTVEPKKTIPFIPNLDDEDDDDDELDDLDLDLDLEDIGSSLLEDDGDDD